MATDNISPRTSESTSPSFHSFFKWSHQLGIKYSKCEPVKDISYLNQNNSQHLCVLMTMLLDWGGGIMVVSQF